MDKTGCVKFRGTLCEIGARYVGQRIQITYAEMPEGPHDVTAYAGTGSSARCGHWSGTGRSMRWTRMRPRGSRRARTPSPTRPPRPPRAHAISTR